MKLVQTAATLTANVQLCKASQLPKHPTTAITNYWRNQFYMSLTTNQLS